MTHPLAPIMPQVRDLRALSTSGGLVQLDCAIEAPVGTEGWKAVLYVDGLAASESALSASMAFAAGPLGVGGHDVAVTVIRDYEIAPRFLADYSGTRLVVDWEPVGDADLAGYNVLVDGTAAESIRDIEADRLIEALPTTGTGSGRITVAGNYRGPLPVNASHTIEITASGWEYDGVARGTIERRVTYQLPGNLQLTFLDDAGDYDTGDEWVFRVGPRTHYVSGELEAGAHTVVVRAVDGAGNVSGDLSIAGYVSGEPDPPAGASASFDDATDTVTLTWTGGATCRLYANWSPVLGAFLDYVEERWEIAEGTSPLTVDLGAARGEFRYYLRAVDGDGREEENLGLGTLDARSAPAAVIAAPFGLSVYPTAGAEALVMFFYDRREGAPASFNLYVFASEPDAAAFDGATPTSVSNAYDAFFGSIARRDVAYSGSAGTFYFAVRAVDGDGRETDNLDYVAAVLDGTGPATPTGGRIGGA